MKKIYQKPVVVVLTFQQQTQLLAGSGEVNTIDSNINIDLGGGGNGPARAPLFDVVADWE